MKGHRNQGTQTMAKKAAKETPPRPQPVQPEKENFLTMFSKIDSRQRHRILAYLIWFLGLFIIFFAYRAV